MLVLAALQLCAQMHCVGVLMDALRCVWVHRPAESRLVFYMPLAFSARGQSARLHPHSPIKNRRTCKIAVICEHMRHSISGLVC